MADITKCVGNGCPVKEQCYRFTAKADEYQSYLVRPPYTLEENVFSCDMYWGPNAQQQHNKLKRIVNGLER